MKHTLLRVCLICLLIAALSCSVLASCADECTHEFGEPTVLTAATCTEKGSQTRTCTLCDETVTEDIPALGHTTEHTVCNTCGTTLLSVEQILPTISQEDLANGLHLAIKDFTVTDTSDDGAGSSAADVTLDFYPTADGVFAYGSIAMTDADGEQTIDFFFDGMKIYAEVTTMTDGQSFTQKAVLACDDLFATIQSDPSLILGQETMAMINKIMDIAETYIFPLFENTEPPAEDVLPTPDDTTFPAYMETLLAEKAQTLIDMFFTVDATDNGTEVVLDLSVLHEWNEEFSVLTLKDLIEMTGEGNYQTIKNTIPVLMSVSVSDALAFMEELTGMTTAELIELVDDIVIAYTGNEEVDLETIIGMPIKDLLEDEEFLATKVSDILAAYIIPGTDDAPATSEDLLKFLDGIIETVETKKIYDLIAQQSETTGDALKAQIDASIDAMEDNLQCTISVGTDGKFAGIKQTVAGMTTVFAPMDGGFSFAISGAPDAFTQVSGNIELTFAPVVLENTDEYDAFVADVEDIVPVIDQTILEDNGYTLVADTPYAEYVSVAYAPVPSDHVGEYTTGAERFTERFNTQTAPFAIRFSEEDGTTFVSMVFLGQSITEHFTYSNSDSVDLDALTPDKTETVVTVIMITVAVTEE